MRKIIYLIAFISLCSFTIEDPFSALLKKLEEFSKKYPTEKVHLHLDKPYYAAGDNIWLKGYVSDARNAQPASESNILYVELINELDTVCNLLRLPLQSGVTWGDFKLADTLVEGNYRIRAYTQLMRNAGPDFFFDKTIKIGSRWTNKASTKTTFANSNASIIFSDSLGKAVVDRPLSYAIRYGDKTIKGKTRTDANGLTNIQLPPDAKTGTIVTTIDLGKGKSSVKTIPITIQATTVDVQFLPEGGQLVAGLTSRVAFKAVAANGKGVDVSGTIVDDQGNEITPFQTSHLGMGSFYFSPAAGKTYAAKIKLKDGTDHSVAMPKSLPSGHVINVSQLDTANINIKVTLSADQLNKGELNLIAHRNGLVYLSAKVQSAKQVSKITMPNAKFPSGIVQLTLFSGENIPVAERIVFVNNTSDRIDLDLLQLKPIYEKREKVALELSSKVSGSFSVAVTNTEVVAPDEANESNILTSMLLSADLKGYIESPNYYFLNADAATKEHLDNLMLTQGWRKIDWKTVGTTTSASTFPAEKGIRISGTITKDKKPLPNSKISLMTNKGGLFMIDTLSDQNGKFAFEGLEFADSVKFVIKARSEVGKKNVDIELDVVEGQKVTSSTTAGELEVNVNQSMQDYLKESTKYFEELNKQGMLTKTIQLKEVTVTSTKLNPARNSQNLNGPGNADQVFDGDDMLNAPTLSGYLFGKMSGMTVKNGRPVLIGGRGIGPVKLIVDGMIMDDFTFDDISPDLVESVEVLISPVKSTIYRSSAVLITTRRSAPKWAVVKYAPGLITYSPKGYYNAREFYSPKYDVAPSDKPDLRTTVFWSPNLATNETGKVKFDYFNTDQAGTYRVVVEGFDVDGKLARKTYTYKVN